MAEGPESKNLVWLVALWAAIFLSLFWVSVRQILFPVVMPTLQYRLNLEPYLIQPVSQSDTKDTSGFLRGKIAYRGEELHTMEFTFVFYYQSEVFNEQSVQLTQHSSMNTIEYVIDLSQPGAAHISLSNGNSEIQLEPVDTPEGFSMSGLRWPREVLAELDSRVLIALGNSYPSKDPSVGVSISEPVEIFPSNYDSVLVIFAERLAHVPFQD